MPSRKLNKRFKLIYPKQGENHPYKSKYYSDGKTAISYSQGQRVIKGEKKFSQIAKTNLPEKLKPTPTLAHLPGFILVYPKKGESGHPFRGRYFTDGTVSFSYRQGRDIASGKKKLSEAIVIGIGGRKYKGKKTGEKESVTYEVYSEDKIFYVIHNVNTGFSHVIITLRGISRRDSLKGKPVWRSPLPPATIEVARSQRYRERFDEVIRDLLSRDLESILFFHVTYYNKGK